MLFDPHLFSPVVQKAVSRRVVAVPRAAPPKQTSEVRAGWNDKGVGAATVRPLRQTATKNMLLGTAAVSFLNPKRALRQQRVPPSTNNCWRCVPTLAKRSASACHVCRLSHNHGKARQRLAARALRLATALASWRRQACWRSFSLLSGHSHDK